MTWLQTLFDFIKECLPWISVRQYERGVRHILWPFCEAKVTGPHRPGFYLRLPLVWDMDKASVVEQNIDLKNCSLVTKDKVSVTLSANVNFEIIDLVKATCNIHDLDQSIRIEAMKYLHRTCRRANFDTLLKRQGGVEYRIREALQKKTEDWGLRIIDVGLTDLVPAKAYRFYGEYPTH